jgi:serine/threonine-protein kinase
MEFLSGGTLRDLMRARGRLDEGTAASLAMSIADGLEAAHVRGVLHRDLKPDNILLDAEGRPKLGDFGIARIAAATALTRTGEVLGSPQYLAPEQMTGDVVDERVDVYGLGVILYEMLSGAQPTGGSTASEIVSRRLRSNPRPLRRLAPVSKPMEAVVMRALARDPARRFARARVLRAALAPLAANAPVAAPAPVVVSAPVAAPAPIAAPAPVPRARVVAPRQDRRRPLAAAFGLLVAMLGASVVFGSSRPLALAPVSATPAPSPAAAILASTSTPRPATPAPTATPQPTPDPTPEATPEPTPEPTARPTPAPTLAARPFDQGPADTILAFYDLVSGHDYGAAAGLWSDKMRAVYPPQTNIWGRFDATRQIVARSAAVVSATSGSAAVNVDLVETMRDGTTRRWVGTWYLVRSGSGWLMDQPGLRPG